MAVALVGAAKTAGASTSPFSPTYNQSPTANNLLVFSVQVFASGGSAPTVTTPAGWTLAAGGSPSNSGTTWTGIWVFYRIATGGDSAPSVTVTGSSYRWVMEEWSGLATSSVVDIASGVTTSISTSATGNVDSPSLTTTNPTDWIYSVTVGRLLATPTAIGFTWGGGSSQDFAAALASNTIGTATQNTSTAGTYTPTNAYSMTGTTPVVMQTVSVAFKQFGTSVNIAVPTSSNTASALTPIINSGSNLQATTATSTGQALVPTIVAGINITSVIASDTSLALPPTVSVGVNLLAPVSVSIGQARIPVIVAGATLTTPVAVTLAQAYAPVVMAGANIQAPTAISISSARLPSISISINVSVDMAANSVGLAYSPAIGSPRNISITFDIEDDKFIITPNRVRWSIEPLTGHWKARVEN